MNIRTVAWGGMLGGACLILGGCDLVDKVVEALAQSSSATLRVAANRSATWSITPGGLDGSGAEGSYTVSPGVEGTTYTVTPGTLEGYVATVSSSDGVGPSLTLLPGQSKHFSISYDAIPAASVQLGASPSAITAGQGTTLTWNASNANRCSAPWTSQTGVSGSQSLQPASTTTYTIICFGSNTSASASTTVTVVPAPPANATIQISSNRSSTWTITPGGISGSGTNGSVTVVPASGGTLYTIAPGSLNGFSATVSGSDGSGPTLTLSPGQTKSFTILYSALPAPVVSLSVSRGSIAAGESSTLTWVATNATTCGAPWTPQTGTLGSQSVVPSATTSYSITCSGPGGTGTDTKTVTVAPLPTSSITVNANRATSWTINPGSVQGSGTTGIYVVSPNAAGTAFTIVPAAVSGHTVVVSSPDGVGSTLTLLPGQQKSFTVTYTPIAAPTVSLIASPTAIQAGQNAMLNWASTNASACQASWTGSTATAGSQLVTPSTTTTYSISCTGAGGSGTSSASITVTPLPAIGLSATSLTFSAASDVSGLPGTLPPSKAVTITNTGVGALTGITVTVTYSGTGNWLAASLSSTTAPAVLTARLTTAALPPGVYSAEIVVTAPGTANGPQRIQVSYTISTP